MSRLLNIVLIVSLLFSFGCKKGKGQLIRVPVPSPSSGPSPDPGSPVPSPSPSDEPHRPDGHPTGFETVLSASGFAGSKTLYLFLERNEKDEFNAFADVDGEFYRIVEWEFTVEKMIGGEQITVNNIDPSSLPCPADFIPICFYGKLVGCSGLELELSISFVARARNTVVEGDLSGESVFANMGLCLENGYIPAWEIGCK